MSLESYVWDAEVVSNDALLDRAGVYTADEAMECKAIIQGALADMNEAIIKAAVYLRAAYDHEAHVALGMSWSEFYGECMVLPGGVSLGRAERLALEPGLLVQGFSTSMIGDMLGVSQPQIVADAAQLIRTDKLNFADLPEKSIGVDGKQRSNAKLRAAVEARATHKAHSQSTDGHEVINHETGEITTRTNKIKEVEKMIRDNTREADQMQQLVKHVMKGAVAASQAAKDLGAEGILNTLAKDYDGSYNDDASILRGFVNNMSDTLDLFEELLPLVDNYINTL